MLYAIIRTLHKMIIEHHKWLLFWFQWICHDTDAHQETLEKGNAMTQKKTLVNCMIITMKIILKH